jgi:hypothetical protein
VYHILLHRISKEIDVEVFFIDLFPSYSIACAAYIVLPINVDIRSTEIACKFAGFEETRTIEAATGSVLKILQLHTVCIDLRIYLRKKKNFVILLVGYCPRKYCYAETNKILLTHKPHCLMPITSH